MTSANLANPKSDIQIYGVTKSYADFLALDDVSLTVNEGEFMTLLGPSGSGKSTLLMAIAGFVDPSHGDILMGGRSIVRLAPEDRNFGVVLQGYALFPHMTVAQNIAYPLKIRGLGKTDIEAKVRGLLDQVQLTHLSTRMPKELSGGQQQRVALARALVFSPRVLLLDEPMGALDKKLRHDLQLELRQLHRRLGCTFINVTHDQEEAMAMSDRVAIMRAGKIVQVDNPATLYRRPKTQFVADFLGKSNFLSGKVVGQSEGLVKLECKGLGIILHHSEVALTIGSEVLLALRPQRIKIGADVNTLNVQVVNSIFLGSHTEISVRSPSGQALDVTLDSSESNSDWTANESISICWSPGDTVLVSKT
ncbi:hypothetical protein ALO95_200395 [Pseudomonas syringae pv. antirrhini]|uniref:Spermidine/putrescine ABC transporter ATPase n=1 Tax=Pseudomonas syringae pv. antirrhini TaxID=251702 RepID=A0A0N8QQB6_9PSED|nr:MULTISPECIES: ABC transporter ATP-binding protein [Pseudomonas]KPW52734.1 Spermidine/putrescine ABC transporter ATPase [Pseudomonas syringae pv. antirrhini]RMP32100.1 Spermidine/putrescine ABC transporter ATPase [Pseudomonas syringae pv. antirrhini]RMP42480.1 hypothetical protein ALQ23_200220 [Pseudomonas syringae pv. antirrhini]RMW23533.1 hypothetical protein ALO95_200395 [Pseudomonas syringae pv. antirrhini]WIN08831.1 ABC transporter ATP-binding protein [Pseudomonas syringae pv. antirrhin